jgi:hypothetical protein
MEVSSQLHVLSLYPRTKTPKTEGWVGLRTGREAVQRRKTFCPFRELKPDRPSRSIVAVPSGLSRLKYIGICYRQLLLILPY